MKASRRDLQDGTEREPGFAKRMTGMLTEDRHKQDDLRRAAEAVAILSPCPKSVADSGKQKSPVPGLSFMGATGTRTSDPQLSKRVTDRPEPPGIRLFQMGCGPLLFGDYVGFGADFGTFSLFLQSR